MPASFRTQRRVEFHHTDLAGIIHFATYFLFMEEAEHELLRSVGLSVLMTDGAERLSFPRVAASCSFQRPIRFEDVVDIEVRVERLGEKSITYGFRFTHQEHEIATGSMTSVHCRMDQEPPVSSPIPPEIADKLRAFTR